MAFPVSYFPVCSTTKTIFLGWVKEVRTMKSLNVHVELRGKYVEYIHFFNPVACYFLYKVKDLSAPPLIQPLPFFITSHAYVIIKRNCHVRQMQNAFSFGDQGRIISITVI
jgi:hypothetical protein